MKKNLLLLSLASIFCLLAAELALRIFAPPSPYGFGSFAGPKSRLLGWAPIPNRSYVFTDPDTGEVSYSLTNSQGWKDSEHEIEKPEGAVRLLFVGDSLTWGSVALEDLYSRELERLLKAQGVSNVEVISMGAIGWGADQSLEALKTEGVRYRPDVVVYQFSENDIIDNLLPNEIRSPAHYVWKKTFRYELEGGSLKKLPPRRDSARKIKDSLLKSALVYNLNLLRNQASVRLRKPGERPRGKDLALFYIYNPLSEYFLFSPGEEPPKVGRAWALFEALLAEMKDVTEESGGRFVVFGVAGDEGQRAWDIRNRRFQRDGEREFVVRNGAKYEMDIMRPAKNLSALCERMGIALITPSRPYERYLNDSHPNASGNRRMAEDVAAFLKEWKPFRDLIGSE